MNRILPPAVKNILIINGLFFLATIIFEERFQLDLANILGLHFFTSPLFKPFQLVTHVFMHGNFGHIFSNMLALWMFGSVLENLWGPKKFLTYYFICAFGAAFLHLGVSGWEINKEKTQYELFTESPDYQGFQKYLNEVPLAKQLPIKIDERENGYVNVKDFMEVWGRDKQSTEASKLAVKHAEKIYEEKRDVATVGASGAVFGLLLAFGMFFPNEMVFIGFFFPMKAKYFVALYGFFELYNGFANNPADNVAHFAHLGGMLFGFFLIKFWQRRNL